jgi:hypothetical protein
MHRWERPQGFLKEPPATGTRRRTKRPGKRLFWRDIVVRSKLYGRSRWLHSSGSDEAELGGHRSAGED